METKEATKKAANATFGKKNTSTGKYDPKKRYQFQLCEIISTAKPRDYDTGELVDNPYPPLFLWTNSGQAINPDSMEIEDWRYIYGYHSIWVKDQMAPLPSKSKLENPKNFIEFKNGSLFVSGANTALMDAMMIQDEFEEVVNPINIKPPVYRLVNLDKERKRISALAELAFEAEKSARELKFEDLIPMAMHFGIIVDNPEENYDSIRDQFIQKVKEHPDFFNKNFNNPKVKYKYVITKAMQQGVISQSVVPGKMALVSSGAGYFDIMSGDTAEQFANLVLNNDPGAVSLYNLINQ